MGATVRSISQVDTNVVDPAIALNLPVPMTYGEISLGLRFEQQPGGNLTYKGIHQDDKQIYENAYPEGSRFRIDLGDGDPVWVMVESYGYSRERVIYGSAPNEITLDTYEVNISLTGGNSKGVEGLVETKRLISSNGKISLSRIASAAGISCSSSLRYYETSDRTSLSSALGSNVRRRGYVDYCSQTVQVRNISSGKSWRFSAGEIETDGENTRGEIPYHRKAVLQDTWSSLPNDDDLNTPDWEREDSRGYSLTEQDDEPEEPPSGTSVLRTLDSNFDKGGPKKTRKVITYRNGTKVREQFWVWGFMYTAEQIAVDDTGLIFSSKPSDFWQVIEYTDTTIKYQDAPTTTVSISAWDDNGASVPQIIHPSYERFAKGSGRGFSVRTTQELLTEENTKGWRMARYQEETDDLETLFPEDPFYDSYQFNKLDKGSQRAWKIKPSRDSFISGDEAQPFRLEFMALGDMPPGLQKLTGLDATEQPDRLIAVIYPEANFTEQFWIQGFSEYSNSFGAMEHPENSEDNPQPPFVTGQESLKSEENTPYDRSTDTGLFRKHRKRTVSYSSQDAGFERSALQIKSQEFDGSPSSPTSRSSAWKERETARSKPDSRPRYQYLVSSDSRGRYETGSISAQNVESLSEALRAIKNQLIIDTANTITSSRNIMWWLPRIRPWDKVSVTPERFTDGTWRVLEVSFNVKVDPSNIYTNGLPFCTTEGTQLRLGLHKNRSVTAIRDRLEDADEPTEDRGFRSSVSTAAQTIGGEVDFLKNRETRRKFNV